MIDPRSPGHRGHQGLWIADLTATARPQEPDTGLLHQVVQADRIQATGLPPEMAVQRAAANILLGSRQPIEDLKETSRRRRDLMVKGLRKAGWNVSAPRATLYLWTRIPEGYADSSDAGRLHLVEASWDEKTITYNNRPEPGPQIGTVGRVAVSDRRECPLEIDLDGRKEVSIALVPVNCDGAGFFSRESKYPAQLVVKFELK